MRRLASPSALLGIFPAVAALDTVSLVKGFPRLPAREAVLDAIFDRVSAGLFQDVVSHLKRFRRPDRRRGPI